MSIKLRVNQIREKVPLSEILNFYGYDVRVSGTREQQFSCDLHGDGYDSKPSARYYPGSDSWYCWACDKSRDAISTVQEKEGCDFSTACFFLEKRYGIKYTYTPKIPEVNKILKKKSYSEEKIVSSVEDTLMLISKEKVFSFIGMLSIWEKYDKVSYLRRIEKIDSEQYKSLLLKIKENALEKYKKIQNEHI